jgi:chemotaxis protein MotC
VKKTAATALRVLAVLAFGTVAARGEADDHHQLQPYQMVRSLQLVQDRIAGGDHAALPMQTKLLEMIDARFRAADASEFDNARNLDALLIYAMSGGNPATIAETMERLDLPADDRQLGEGVVAYLSGDVAGAREAMSVIAPMNHPPELAAFLALVKGSVTSSDDAQAAIAILDRARLIGPGTLVEEAALRRTIALTVTTGDAGRFMNASEQYARRFLRSPYASQFAESFVAGIIELSHQSIDFTGIEATVDWMTHEQARTVYLRLARRAAIDGNSALLDFASRKAADYPGGALEAGGPRSELYSSISSITSETVDEVLARLKDLDPRGLSAADRALLKAAKTVAAGVVAPVAEIAVIPPPGERDGSTDTLVADETTRVDDIITSARTKLEAIDEMLEGTTQ